MYNSIDMLGDIEDVTGIPFRIEYKNGKIFYQGKLECSKADKAVSILIGNEKLNLLVDRKYEICTSLLKYTIENRIREIKSKQEEILINLLSSKEVLEDDLYLNFPFLDRRTIIFLIHLEGSRYDALNIIKELYSNTSAFAAIYGDDILLIKNSEDNREHAGSIRDSIVSELYTDCSVSYGNEIESFKEIKTCYDEAKKAQLYGETYGNKDNIYCYSQLMLENIAYNLSGESKKEMLTIVKHKLDKFDSEMINTIEEFIKADLNISEASKRLYVHRNTLIYRLDKIYKETGFDIRLFNQASVFIIAYLVWKANK
jgi:sugar diacid utilization regulator